MEKERLDKEFSNARKETWALAAGFVRTELSVGFKLAQSYVENLTKGQSEKSAKELQLAKQSLIQCRRFLPFATFTEHEREDIQERIDERERLFMPPADSKPPA
jgi:hypothetical protein